MHRSFSHGGCVIHDSALFAASFAGGIHLLSQDRRIVVTATRPGRSRTKVWQTGRNLKCASYLVCCARFSSSCSTAPRRTQSLAQAVATAGLLPSPTTKPKIAVCQSQIGSPLRVPRPAHELANDVEYVNRYNLAYTRMKALSMTIPRASSDNGTLTALSAWRLSCPDISMALIHHTLFNCISARRSSHGTGCWYTSTRGLWTVWSTTLSWVSRSGSRTISSKRLQGKFLKFSYRTIHRILSFTRVNSENPTVCPQRFSHSTSLAGKQFSTLTMPLSTVCGTCGKPFLIKWQKMVPGPERSSMMKTFWRQYSHSSTRTKTWIVKVKMKAILSSAKLGYT